MRDFAARLTFTNGKTLELAGPGDITKETTEAIVNAANSTLLGGGGVDGAIHRAGGPSILADCRRIVAKIGTLPAGKAVITTGGRLAAKYVVHTVGPIYRGGKQHEAETLAGCYRESIRVADDHGIRSLAFPSISTGAYAYPVHEACRRCQVRDRVAARYNACAAHSLRALRHGRLQHLRSRRRNIFP
jgi:O-acetyl-ADP-ribose deacetylase (regulator of RNase III)